MAKRESATLRQAANRYQSADETEPDSGSEALTDLIYYADSMVPVIRDFAQCPGKAEALSQRVKAAHGAPRQRGGRVPDDKYARFLGLFVRLMNTELHANADKGDRANWLSMSSDALMLEVYYHAAKLQKAVRDGDAPRIKEHSADVANMSMMLLDLCIGLTEMEESAIRQRVEKEE